MLLIVIIRQVAGVGAEFKLLRSGEDWVLTAPQPAPFPLEPEMVASKGFGPYFSVYRHQEFEQLSAACVSPDAPFGKDGRALRRRIHGGAFDVGRDPVGCLPIPLPLIDAAGLDANSDQPLTVVAFPEHIRWAHCDNWAFWAIERRWEALELMQKRSQPEPMITAVRGFYIELVEELQRDPAGVFRLKPRVFEELCAELMAHQGFEVELTPESRDGGVDLYAVRHTAFGRFLLVVDCKRYLPSRPVGVGIVRGMLGTIDVTRASAGLVLSTSRFSGPARSLAGDYPFRIGLQDYFDLQRLLDVRTGGDWPPGTTSR
jgi:hypothetical protein